MSDNSMALTASNFHTAGYSKSQKEYSRRINSSWEGQTILTKLIRRGPAISNHLANEREMLCEWGAPLSHQLKQKGNK